MVYSTYALHEDVLALYKTWPIMIYHTVAGALIYYIEAIWTLGTVLYDNYCP